MKPSIFSISGYTRALYRPDRVSRGKIETSYMFAEPKAEIVPVTGDPEELHATRIISTRLIYL